MSPPIASEMLKGSCFAIKSQKIDQKLREKLQQAGGIMTLPYEETAQEMVIFIFLLI